MKARRKDEDHKFDGENMTVINFLMPKKKKKWTLFHRQWSETEES